MSTPLPPPQCVVGSDETMTMWLARPVALSSLVAVVFVVVVVVSAKTSPARYLNHDNLTRFLHNIHEKYDNITDLYTVGKSVEGRPICVCTDRAGR